MKRKKIQEEYNQKASRYQEEWSYYIQATTTEALQRLNLKGDDTILDVGCGTGYLLSFLETTGFTGDLYGADLSTNMLREARGITETQRYGVANAEQLPYRDDSFDVLISCNSFHFFPNPKSFLREAQRVLREGGKLYVTDWNDDYWACLLCDYYLRFSDPAHTQVYGSQDLISLLENTRFDVQFLDTYKIDWLWGLMTLEARLPKTRTQ